MARSLSTGTPAWDTGLEPLPARLQSTRAIEMQVGGLMLRRQNLWKRAIDGCAAGLEDNEQVLVLSLIWMVGS